MVLLIEAPYVNWQRAHPPIAGRMVIRQDAMGDGRYGSRRSGGRRHRGLDVAASVGTPVLAIRSGRVKIAGAGRGEGKYVSLDHGGGWRSVYLHLSSMEVRPGQRVRQGQRLGAVGKTGNARHPWIAPHLHIEITRRGEAVDPATLGLTGIVPEPDRSDSASDDEDAP